LAERFDLSENRGRLARRLSGGQKQRLALALAVVNNPEIVLLDEPTSALDPHGRRAIWGIIRQLHGEGRTVVITTHSMEEAEALCGRVAIIDSGQVMLPGVHTTRYSGQYLEIETVQPQATMAALHDLALQLGRSIGDVMLRQPNLEDVFLKLTGKQLSA
jgi:ABC-2 type transport system ATP-binding protein